MRHLIGAIFIFGTSASAHADKYSLGSEPWSGESFEICPKSKTSNLRAVLFEPEIEEWTYILTEFPTAELVATKAGIKEVVGKDIKERPAFFLKNQKIGYLNDLNEWVRQDGSHVNDFNQFESISGERVEPEIRPFHEKRVYKSDIELEHAAAMERLHYAPPCTAFSVDHHDKLESTLQYDSTINNPLECNAEGGFRRSEKFNTSETRFRSVIAYVHGTSYYIKFPNGNAQAFSWTGIERLYNPDGSMICDWGEINAYAGHELIQKD